MARDDRRPTASFRIERRRTEAVVLAVNIIAPRWHRPPHHSWRGCGKSSAVPGMRSPAQPAKTAAPLIANHYPPLPAHRSEPQSRRNLAAFRLTMRRQCGRYHNKAKSPVAFARAISCAMIALPGYSRLVVMQQDDRTLRRHFGAWFPDWRQRIPASGMSTMRFPAFCIPLAASTMCWRWSRLACSRRSWADARSGWCRPLSSSRWQWRGRWRWRASPCLTTEIGIALSVIALGIAGACKANIPTAVAMASGRTCLRCFMATRTGQKYRRHFRALAMALASLARPRCCMPSASAASCC